MQNRKYFQDCMRIIVLFCATASVFVNNEADGISDAESRPAVFTTGGSISIRTLTTAAADTCTKGQFRCVNGECIFKEQECDGQNDCEDESDEASCENCSSAAFTCRSGQCVLGSFQCNNRTDCIDESDEICPEGFTPRTWHEYWHIHPFNYRLTRVFASDGVVLYFDPDMDKQVDWFFRPLSEAWKYATETYGPIGTMSNLYVVLHEGKKDGCITGSFESQHHGHRTTLDCGQIVPNKWAKNTTVTFETLLSPLGTIIREGAQVILNDADNNICEDKISDIFSYDILVHLKGEFSAEVSSWESKTELKSVTVKGKDYFCFRDWFLPIYKQFGRSGVLNRYLENTKAYWTQHDTSGYTNFKLGEWVHFWSGSAGVDLQPLALKAFNWSNENDQDFKQARKTYPALLYPVNNYTLAYEDKNIDIEFENYQTVNYTIYDTLSRAWKYVKANYNPLNVNPRLQIILNDRDDVFRNTDCPVSHNTKSTLNVGSNTDNHRDHPHYGYTMKCGKSIYKKWELASSGMLDDILVQMAQLALTKLLVTQEVNELSKQLTMDLNLQSLIVFDIYQGLKLTQDADRWKAEQSLERENFPRKSTYLFRDWYLEIYNAYNTKSVKVVKEFVLLVNERFNLTSDSKARGLTVGEFVHFWSGAVEENLLDLAVKCFKLNSDGIEQFYEAQKKFPGLSYDCGGCKDSNTTETTTTSALAISTPQEPPILPEPPKRDYTVAIVVSVSATILIAAFICFGVKFVIDRRRIAMLSREIRNLTPIELDEFYLGNPNLSSRDAHAPIHSLPFKNEFEVPRERLIIDEKRVLGSGAFGIVKRGLLLGDDFLGTSDTVVAVKTVKQMVNIMYFKAQLLEIKIMAHLGKHENIASLLATVTKNIVKCEVFFALEFCSKGDLHQYLRKHRENFTDLWRKCKSNNCEPSTSSNCICSGSKSDTDVVVTIVTSSGSGSTVEYRNATKAPVLVSTLDLLTWSREIACGMEYLGLKEVIHGDLAARNVLLTENNVAKISDFGLSRQLVNYSNYLKTSTSPLPWRWLAIESLTQMSFSINSDIWSFGVTLWELFTLGNIPYPGRSWDQKFVNELSAGLRLEAPDFGDREIYNLMLSCMIKVPGDRMPFAQIGAELEKIRANLVKATPQSSTSNFRESREAQYLTFHKNIK